jgi:AcrR family transcriptional regulator
MLSLIDEGSLRPTARDVSERAGVSLRSVFQHFQDLESLFAAASDRQVERLTPLLAERVEPTLPFDERVMRFAESRSRLLEAVSPVRRAVLLQAPFSPELARRMRWSHQVSGEAVCRTFGPELAALPDDTRNKAAPALRLATDWYAWETLRVHEGLNADQAREVMAHTIRTLLRKE